MDNDEIILTEHVEIPGPTLTGTVLLPPPTGRGIPAPTDISWTWLMVIGVVGLIALVFTVRYGWNIAREK